MISVLCCTRDQGLACWGGAEPQGLGELVLHRFVNILVCVERRFGTLSRADETDYLLHRPWSLQPRHFCMCITQFLWGLPQHQSYPVSEGAHVPQCQQDQDLLSSPDPSNSMLKLLWGPQRETAPLGKTWTSPAHIAVSGSWNNLLCYDGANRSSPFIAQMCTDLIIPLLQPCHKAYHELQSI